MVGRHEPCRGVAGRRVARARLQEMGCPACVGDGNLQRLLARLARRNAGLLRRAACGALENGPEGKQHARVERQQAAGHLGAVPFRIGLLPAILSLPFCLHHLNGNLRNLPVVGVDPGVGQRALHASPDSFPPDPGKAGQGLEVEAFAVGSRQRTAYHHAQRDGPAPQQRAHYAEQPMRQHRVTPRAVQEADPGSAWMDAVRRRHRADQRRAPHPPRQGVGTSHRKGAPPDRSTTWNSSRPSRSATSATSRGQSSGVRPGCGEDRP